MSKQATPKVNLQKAEAVAQFVGLTARRIYQLTDAGILPVIDTADGKRYDFNETVRRYIKYLQGLAAGKEVNLSEAEAKKERQRLILVFVLRKHAKQSWSWKSLKGRCTELKI